MLLCSILVANPTQDYEYTKVIKKETKFSSRGTLVLDNVYGPVTIKAWSRNRARVEATISVKADGEAQAQRIFDQIQVNISTSYDRMGVATNIKANDEWWVLSNNTSYEDYNISYIVYLPTFANVSASTRHGDINVRGIKGNVNLNLEHGNLRASGLGEKTTVFISDGSAFLEDLQQLHATTRQAKVNLGRVKRVEIDSRSSQLRLREAEEVVSRSKYDTYHLENVGHFINNGRYDDIEIGHVREVDINSRLTDLQIYKLEKYLNLEMDSSEVRIERVQPIFQHITLGGESTDFRIGMAKSGQYQVDAVANYAGICYPNGLRILHEEEKSNRHELQAQKGARYPNRVVRARLTYGSLKLTVQE